MAALEAMTKELRHVFRERPEANQDITVLQARYMLALAEIVPNFMRRAGVGDDIAQRFVELGDAIRGRRFGITAAPVRAAKAGGGGLDGLTVWMLRADVVRGLECFLRAKAFKTQKDAAKNVAERHPTEFGRLKHNDGDNLASAILSWRTRINKRKVQYSDQILAFSRDFFAEREHFSSEEFFAEGERVLAQAAREAAEAAF
jgi:hypothetical protein